MANNLFIYSKQLNAGNGVYNINATNGLTYLNTYLVHSTEIDNYRINSNTLKLLIHKTLDDGGINASDLNKCCYCYWSTTGTFYFIDNYVIQSGYVLFYLTKDLWGTYFKKAVLSNLCIGRTNKKLTGVNGLYENIPCTNEETIEYVITSLSIDPNEVNPQPLTEAKEYVYYSYFMVVFALKYNIYQRADGAVSEIGLFGLPFNRIITAYENAKGDKNYNMVDLVKEVIGGIYEINIGNDLNADMLGAWILPAGNFIHTTYNDHIIHFKTAISGFDDEQLTLDKIKPYYATDNRYLRAYTITIDPNYNYYFGGYSLGFELPRTVGDVEVIIKTIIETDNVKVIAQVGDVEKDITEIFALKVTNVDGDVRNSSYILNAIMSGLKLAGTGATAVAGAMTGNSTTALMGGLGLVNTAVGLQQSMLTTRTGGIVNGGDAFTSYWYAGFASNDKIRNPFILHKYKSIRNEDDIVIHKGAIYDCFIGSNLLIDIYNETPIITGDTETYIKCSEITVDGIPSEAREYIAGKLTNGIYIINEA